jgi:hypothetical protein
MSKPITPLDPIFERRLHAGTVEFAYEHFERSCDTMEEPGGLGIVADDGNRFVDNNDYYPAECHPELVRRILLCLNYCKGISSDDLEKQNALLGLNA